MDSKKNSPTNKTPTRKYDWWQFSKDNALSIFFVAVSSIGAIALCYLLTLPQQTPRENFLESAGLVIMSACGSYLVSKMLSELSYNKTLRDDGVQIASNIMVLKKQIENLASWVAQKRALHGGDAVLDTELEHIQQTLQVFRDMNNATLGAVAGVIGDALAQYNTVMDQVSAIRGNASEQTAEIENKMQIASPQEIPALRTQIEQIENESETKVDTLTAQTPLPIPSPPLKKIFSDKCPYCGEINGFEMLDRPGETKSFECKHCNGRFNAHVARGQKVFTRPDRHKKPPDERSPIIARAEIRTSKLKDSLLEKGAWLTGDKESECVKLLQEMNFWIPPKELTAIFSLAVSHDQNLQKYGDFRSPNELQSLICLDNSKTIYNGIVRIFFRILMRGRAFEFEGEKYGWQFPYKNQLEEDVLRKSCLRGYITCIKDARPLVEEDAPWLAKILLENTDPRWIEAAKQIIKEGI